MDTLELSTADLELARFTLARAGRNSEATTEPLWDDIQDSLERAHDLLEEQVLFNPASEAVVLLHCPRRRQVMTREIQRAIWYNTVTRDMIERELLFVHGLQLPTLKLQKADCVETEK